MTAAEVELVLDVQEAAHGAPPRQRLETAVRAALGGRRERAELTIRIVDEHESRQLNRRFRGRDAPTNVLSFPAEGMGAVAPGFIGDMAICAALVEREARDRGKTAEAHWAHLVIHGVLHLVGYDHAEEADAQAMEDEERAILSSLGFGDPYAA